MNIVVINAIYCIITIFVVSTRPLVLLYYNSEIKETVMIWACGRKKRQRNAYIISKESIWTTVINRKILLRTILRKTIVTVRNGWNCLRIIFSISVEPSTSATMVLVSFENFSQISGPYGQSKTA
jgi:hypothetical protein